MLDGFYVGYMSAQAYGMVLFVFRGKSIVGVDAGGVKFDGTFDLDSEQNTYTGLVKVDAPPNIQLVQGINTGPNGLKYEVPFILPKDFLAAPFIELATPIGAVNIKLEKLRDLGDAS